MSLPGSPSTRRKLLLALLAILLLLLIATITGGGAPQISMVYEGATIEIAADKAWSILPGDCIDIRWELEGIESLYVDGEGQVGLGQTTYCPTLGAASPEFRVTAQNGEARAFKLDLRYFPEYLVICLPFAAILLLFALAIHYLLNFRLDERLLADMSWVYAAGIGLLACLLATAADAFSVRQVLQSVGDVFVSLSWQLFGLILAALVFLPLAYQSVRQAIQAKRRADFIVAGAFFAFVLLLYAPFEFGTVAHWEAWVFRAYLEGRPSFVVIELVSRFWLLVPHVLSYIINPDSFSGSHLVNFALFWGKLVLLYGILRRLNVTRHLAFLITLLYMVYPVTAGLMSVRFLLMNFRIFTLLVAVFFSLEAPSSMNRLKLTGMWLALLLHLGSYESGYLIIALVPILWWIHPGRINRNVNLTVIWYLFPIAQVLYIALLTTADFQYYGSQFVDKASASDLFVWETVGYYADIVADVYRQTFWIGWREAVSTLAQNTSVASMAVFVVLVGVAAAYLMRKADPRVLPSRRQTAIGIVSGLLLILASIGVLMWFEKYATDLRTLYVFVPIGAAVAAVSFLLLLSSIVKNTSTRMILIGGGCLLLMIPATSRLFVQYEYFVKGANAKAKVLSQILDQAPAFSDNARVMLITHMTYEDLERRQLIPFRQNMFDSALYVLYGESRPQVAFLCIIGDRCSTNDIDITRNYLGGVRDFSDVVIFQLDHDLSVQLLRDLPIELHGHNIENYDPLRLIDASSPLPPRAVTMLGASPDE